MQVRRGDRSRNQTRARRRDLLAQLSAPLREFLGTEAGSAGALLAAAVTALVLANSPLSHAVEELWHTELALTVGGRGLSMDLAHWINDGLMGLYFFVIGLEVRREFSVGELTDRRRAVIPVLAGVSGMVFPALLYLAINPTGATASGWGVVIGTDTAFMLGALALVGPRFSTQLRVFLLTLTVIDDIVAVTVIGVVYSGDLHPAWLLVMGACLAVMAGFSRLRVGAAAPYVVVLAVLWLATVQAGLHASIAGMLGGLLVAARAPEREAVEGAAAGVRAFRQSPMVTVGRTARRRLSRAMSVNERLQSVLHPWTGYVVVPLFALANAGVDLRGGLLQEALTSALTWGIVLGLVVGKLVGVGVVSVAAARTRLGDLPQGVGEGHVLAGGALTGIGFTVSLLIAGLAFDDARLQEQATVGVLLAAVLATAGGRVLFRLGARVRGEGDADLPRRLSPPVDPAHDHVRGPARAPLTLVEYGDFECPFCARATGVTRELQEMFGDDLRYVFRHLPLGDVHPHAELAARAAEAAGEQGEFWRMHDKLFAHQDRLQVEDLVCHAADLGLDLEQFLADLDSEALAQRVRADVASAEAGGARGTPTFFVGGQRHTGPHDTRTLAAALEAERRGRVTGPRGAGP